jgi:hypothetical protein
LSFLEQKLSVLHSLTVPPGNQNAFRHGLAEISQRCALTPDEQAIRDEISTTSRVLAEVIPSHAAWLIAVNRAIDGVMESN